MTTGVYQTEVTVNQRGVDHDILCNVHYEAIPFSRGSTDGPGGPPLEPDEPAHIEIDYVETVESKQEMVLTSKQESYIEGLIAERLAEQEEVCDD